MAVRRTSLNNSVIKLSALGPRCLSIKGESPSGPKDLEFLVAAMALLTCVTWKWIDGSSLGGVLSFLSRLRKFLVGGGAEAGVYCAFSLFAICFGLL